MLLGIVALSLNACATDAGFSNGCAMIPLPNYTETQKRRLADEIDNAGAGAQWPAFVGDYMAMYAAVKACAGVRT